MRIENLTSRVYSDMDPALLSFVKKYVTSFIKWDLLHFFHRNPHTIDTVENISRYTGRAPETVQRELVELAQSGLLEETHMGKMTIYALASSPKIQAQLAQFVTASLDKQFRIRATYHVIRDMRES
ncbi:MAG: hypothetical protein U9Q70_08965 [Chloroflexota bacterium]|nr:hypothetical protein [Chloroflexota bacterium]